MAIYTILNPTDTMILDPAIKYTGIQIYMNESPSRSSYPDQDCILSFSGTIYNTQSLCHIENIAYESDDASVVIWLYKKYGMARLLALLEGVFVFVLYDYSMTAMESRVFVARSAVGLVPIYVERGGDSSVVIRSADDLIPGGPVSVGPLLSAGTYVEFMIEFQVSAKWRYVDKYTFYVIPRTPFHRVSCEIPDSRVLQDRDLCMCRILARYVVQCPTISVIMSPHPYSIYMTNQLNHMGIVYKIIEPNEIGGIEGIVMDIRDMTYLSCGSEESNEIMEDEMCRGLLLRLCDDIATSPKRGPIQYPFLDQSWIEFYMTLCPRLRKEVF